MAEDKMDDKVPMPPHGESPNTSPANDAVMKKVETLVAWLLLGGVIVSMATVFLGLAVMFTRHPEYFHSAADLRRLSTPGAAFPHSLQSVAGELAHGRGEAIVALGLLLLIATPVLRVAISLVGFAMQRDWAFTAITAWVLVVLLLSFYFGKTE